MDKEVLRKELEACGAIRFGKFVLASGKESDYYVDMKKAMTNPSILKKISEAMADMVKGADRLAGMELGAIPLVTALSLETGIPFLMVRKGKKGHGTRSQVEGEVNEGDKVVVVEDVTTTGKSPLKAVMAVREEGGVVEKVVVIVDRQEGAAELMEKEGLEYKALLLRDDIKK
jgi:orotate phosphoribosyltransferase